MANFFRRVEKKYVINEKAYLNLQKAIKDKMIEDEYGKSIICNIYFDTDNYDLISHSITKPVFKDKLRLRSYNIPNEDSKVFLEIKRKYDGVVSKRRIEMTLKEFYQYIKNEENDVEPNQIQREINYYFKYYSLKPKMFLSYERTAYYDKDNKDFRITFDNNILARNYDLKLEVGSYGTHVIDENIYIMEVKTLGSMPRWFVDLLNELKIYPCGFSKYGEAYKGLILKNKKMNEEEKKVC